MHNDAFVRDDGMVVGDCHVHFDGMAWPRADSAAIGEIEWRLRYGREEGCPPTRSDELIAAAILAAWTQMVMVDPKSKRDYVVRRLRDAAVRAGGRHPEIAT